MHRLTFVNPEAEANSELPRVSAVITYAARAARRLKVAGDVSNDENRTPRPLRNRRRLRGLSVRASLLGREAAAGLWTSRAASTPARTWHHALRAGRALRGGLHRRCRVPHAARDDARRYGANRRLPPAGRAGRARRMVARSPFLHRNRRVFHDGVPAQVAAARLGLRGASREAPAQDGGSARFGRETVGRTPGDRAGCRIHRGLRAAHARVGREPAPADDARGDRFPSRTRGRDGSPGARAAPAERASGSERTLRHPAVTASSIRCVRCVVGKRRGEPRVAAGVRSAASARSAHHGAFRSIESR